MKKTVSSVLVLLVSVALMSLVGFNAAFAYGGGGDYSSATDTSISTFESDSEVNVSIPFPRNIHVSWAEEKASPVKLTKYQHSQFGNKVVKSNWQSFLEWVESIGDLGTGGTQAGVYGYAVYCWYVGEAVVLVPVSICWQVPKHTTRTLYGLATGNLDTVHEVNKRSWNGRIVNGLVVEGLINLREGKRGNSIPYASPTRTHDPVKDITHFRGVK